ncbi:MAG: hypothetical protein GY805_20665 [Chloroflexi bacterium]|nr:hypothetical protein [Chloroflexota bacterium]
MRQNTLNHKHITQAKREILSNVVDRPSGSREWRLCSLPPFEFMRRFLQHVLPKGFVKVRYYGFFSPGQRRRLRQIVAWFTPPKLDAPSPSTSSTATEQTSIAYPPPSCPHCGQPLHLTQRLIPLKRLRQPS